MQLFYDLWLQTWPIVHLLLNLALTFSSEFICVQYITQVQESESRQQKTPHIPWYHTTVQFNMDMSGVELTDMPKINRIYSAGLDPANPDFSGWLRLSKIAAGPAV